MSVCIYLSTVGRSWPCTLMWSPANGVTHASLCSLPRIIATHAVVYARLLIDGKDYGIHEFMVQLRDDKHDPMPGVDVGDIGPKVRRYLRRCRSGLCSLLRGRRVHRGIVALCCGCVLWLCVVSSKK